MKYTATDIKNFYEVGCKKCKHYSGCIVNRGLDDETKHWIGACPRFFRYIVPYKSYITDQLEKQDNDA